MTGEESGARPHALQGRTLRWSVLGLLLGVVVACLAWSTWTVLDRGVGSNPVKRIDSLIDPAPDPAAAREKALSAARTFVQRFNTYGPDLLEANGKMPDYAAVGDLMTSKFAKVFEGNVGYAEQTVTETGIDRVGTVYAVGVASIDRDSAELLVAGVVQFSYPDPDNAEERIPFEPLRFRYQVSVVQLGGEWKVDDLDDLDDELPSFAEASIPEGQAPGQSPSAEPSGSADPSGTADPSPSGSATGGAQ